MNKKPFKNPQNYFNLEIFDLRSSLNDKTYIHFTNVNNNLKQNIRVQLNGEIENVYIDNNKTKDYKFGCVGV